ncbi:triose-phosphate isomerase [Gudongella sp. SC589]|uniref:triose-phosphate isomerase n=1 Tax=Gudongella sp. SC589 TaxID=3385990 RepID=UPI0039049D93
MRKPIIAGNWKMNKTISEAAQLIGDIKRETLNQSVEAVLCVPYLSIGKAKEMTEGSGIKIGAQNMHWEENGAFTGEISPIMLNELKVDYVILGHSERRQYFNETDETVNKKVHSAIAHGIAPIVCVGETLEQRRDNRHKEIVRDQVKGAFLDIDKNDAKKTVIAYEPIWAIGTGETASSEQAEEMCALVRNTIEEIYDAETAESIRIQYGGSVKPGNVSELMSMDNIDGALVGGASLKSSDFVKLINY